MSLRAMATYEKGLDEYKDEDGKSFTDNNYETAESSSPYYIMHARRCLSDGYGREQVVA